MAQHGQPCPLMRILYSPQRAHDFVAHGHTHAPEMPRLALAVSFGKQANMAWFIRG